MYPSEKEIGKIEQLYEDKTWNMFLSSLLIGFLIGLVVGPFLAIKLFPNFFCS